MKDDIINDVNKLGSRRYGGEKFVIVFDGYAKRKITNFINK